MGASGAWASTWGSPGGIGGTGHVCSRGGGLSFFSGDLLCLHATPWRHAQLVWATGLPQPSAERGGQYVGIYTGEE